MSDFPTIALSVRQPWAWAIIHAGKDIENRTRRAITLGNMEAKRIAIHASGGMTRDEYEDAGDFMDTLGIEVPRPNELVRGAIVGCVDVVDVVKQSESPWFFGPWGLVLANASPSELIACKGALGFFRWSEGLSVSFAGTLPWMLSWPERPRRHRKSNIPAAQQVLL